jgi:DNA-binding NarL/FixJ family response regulator
MDEPDMEVVGQAADGQEAVELTAMVRPDVVLMDVTMPRLDGIEATRRIKSEMPYVRVIGLSMHEKEDLARAMQEAGAVAYLSKNGCSETLIETIRAAG